MANLYLGANAWSQASLSEGLRGLMLGLRFVFHSFWKPFSGFRSQTRLAGWEQLGRRLLSWAVLKD